MSGMLQKAQEAMSGMMGGNSNNQQQQQQQQGGSGVNDPNSSTSGTGGGMNTAQGDKYEPYVQKGESAFKKEFGGNTEAMRAEQGFESADKYRMMANGQQMGQGQGQVGQGTDPSMGGAQQPTQGAVSGSTNAQDKVSAPQVPGSASNVGVNATGGMSDANDSAN